MSVNTNFQNIFHILIGYCKSFWIYTQVNYFFKAFGLRVKKKKP